MSVRVVVIGAGAAGLTAAIRAAESGAHVTLLNAHPKVGLKILMSGGTRCNVTHREVSERDYFGGSRHVVARILRAFTPEQTRAWLEDELGVALKTEDTGKLFPVTDDAQTVLDALLATATRAGVTLESGARVVRLERAAVGADAGAGGGAGEGSDSGSERTTCFRIGIQTVRDSAAFDATPIAAHGEAEWPLPDAEPDRWIEAERVIVATGGLSFPRTGSDGVGYALLQALGHTLEPPVPALTPLASDDPIGRALQGMTLDMALTLRVAGKRVHETRGSFLFAHFGYSGPAALDMSRHWLRAGSAGGAERRVTASFLPDVAPDALLAELVDAARSAPQRSLKRQFVPRLPERLAERLCEEAGLSGATNVGQVRREERAALVERITARDLRVTGTLGYEKAEVTAGGVRLSEVDPSTLESRVVPGLFLCGEVLDVEGRLGGFNFQFAWSSGTVAGRSAAST
ncbi:MAG: NAD(P)/FAD-dependent oxidoreductase [Candidatus Eisenbacteria bacterium]